MIVVPNLYTCGVSIPYNNPHAISVLLPTMQDVIGYEEHDETLLSRLESAYPRFRRNHYVAKACDQFCKSDEVPAGHEIFPVSSAKVGKRIRHLLGSGIRVIEYHGLHFLAVPNTETTLKSSIQSFLQHTGGITSSRQAEDFLLREGVLDTEFIEERKDPESCERIIQETLADAYDSRPEDVFLMNCGMNAFYSTFESLRQHQEASGRTIFIQLGWLYLDSMEIIKKYSSRHLQHFGLLELDALAAYLSEHHREVAAVMTEIPTNPLIQTVDLPRLSALLKKYQIPLAVDTSVGSAYTMHVMPYCDIVIESLTKFGGGHTDGLMGAVVLNPASEHAQAIREKLRAISEPPYIKDIQRFAWSIQGYKSRVERISENAKILIPYFQQAKKIKHVYWALEGKSGANFQKIQKEDRIPGLVSLVFDGPLQPFYDRLSMLKGPSFGSEFTLGMPYVYLAHYDLLRTVEGRSELASLGIESELLRVSIGIDSPHNIISDFERL